MSNWTPIPHPASDANTTINIGNPIGLLLALTYATQSTVPGNDPWTLVPQPTLSSWTPSPSPTLSSWTTIPKPN